MTGGDRHKVVRGKPAVLASLVVHGVAVVVAVRWTAVPAVEPRAGSLPAVAPPRAPPLTAEPIAVTIFDDSSGGAAGGGRNDRRAGRRETAGQRGDARIAGAQAGAAGEIPGRESGKGSPWMKMRGPELGVSDAFVGRFLGNSRPLETIRKSGRVDPAGGGTSVIRDRVTRVAVERDGTAHFHDKRDVDIHWDFHLPTPGEIVREVRQAGRDVAEWYADPYKLARVGPAQDVPRHLLATPGACDHWDDACSIELRQRDQPEDKDRSDGLAHGKLDLTAMLMRKFVGDPYASRKLALLDSTRDERAELGARHAKEDLARSAELMRRNLEALWRTTSDPAARRQALFTLWDECGEGDGQVGEAGQRARLIVIGWIRAKLPAGSPDAFTDEDIAQLAAHRTSRQAFTPYE